MISSIKNKEKGNEIDELSKYFQNTKIVIRQESNVTLEKTIQFETRYNNKKDFSHEFNENNIVDYTAFVEKKRARNKNV